MILKRFDSTDISDKTHKPMPNGRSVNPLEAMAMINGFSLVPDLILLFSYKDWKARSWLTDELRLKRYLRTKRAIKEATKTLMRGARLTSLARAKVDWHQSSKYM